MQKRMTIALVGVVAVALLLGVVSRVQAANAPVTWDTESTSVAATVGDATITEGEVNQALADSCAAAGVTTQGELDAWLKEDGHTLDELREQRLSLLEHQERVRQMAVAWGVEVTDAEVDSAVRAARTDYLFETMDSYPGVEQEGEQEQAAWEQSLAEAGYTEDTYRVATYCDLLEEKTREVVRAAGEDYDALLYPAG